MYTRYIATGGIVAIYCLMKLHIVHPTWIEQIVLAQVPREGGSERQ